MLELACQRIHALPQPACIKSSELHYIACNQAYADIFGQMPEAFAGHSSLDFDPAYSGSQREEAERRCVIFGDDAQMLLYSPVDNRAYTAFAEQFSTDEGGIYVFEYLEPVRLDQPLPADSTEPATFLEPANDQTNDGDQPPLPSHMDILNILEEAIGAVDVVIFILSPDDRLVYGNQKFKEFYAPFLGNIQIGDDITKGLEIAAREYVLRVDGGEPTDKDVEEWVARHLSEYRLPHFEKKGWLTQGQSVHVVNRLLSNGYVVAMRFENSEAERRESLLTAQKEELSLFKAVLDNVPVANFARDEDNRMIYVNDTYCKLVGRSAEELIGSSLEDLFGENAEKYARLNREMAEYGGLIEQEQNIPNSAGKTIPVVTRIGWLTLENGRSVLVGSMTDVTNLKIREAELEETQQKALHAEMNLHNIIDSVDFGIFVVNKETLMIEMANGAVRELWEAPALGSLEGLTFTELLDFNFENERYQFDEDAFAEYRDQWIKHIRSDTAMPDRYFKSATQKHLIVRGAPLDAQHYMITYNDVSELKEQKKEADEARNQLAETGLLMNEALASMQQGFVITDRKMRILVSNEAARNMLLLPEGLTEPGQTWTSIIEYCLERDYFTETMEELNDIWRQCRSDGEPMQMVARVDEESWIRFEIKATPEDLRVVTMTDITAERERQDELEKLVARAETADKAKSEFLANMSHEIRTPMNGILGMAELLAKSELDNKQQTFTDVIVKSGNALLTIINDILDFSKIDAGQMKLRNGVFDPLEAVEDVATLLSAAASEKEVELIIKGSQNLPESVQGDAGRFRQIITNLVGNAVKFTEIGHILIELSYLESEDEPALSIAVSDTGIGIPQDKLKAVFEKFSQVDGSSTRRHEGTGLGLAITAGLVNLFGGTIDVDSKVGSGSTFTVTLPLKASSAAPKRVTPVQKPGARVLVIDDNEVNRKILMEQLAGWGYDACAAEDGQQGLAVLEAAHGMQLPVDLIILDYHMPNMNGVDVAREIRAKAWFDQTPIMFLTSMEMAADEHRFADMKVQAHLMKPARSQLLKKTVGSLLATPLAATASDMQDEISDDAQSVIDETSAPEDNETAQASALDILIAEDNEVNQIVFTQILQQTRHHFQIAGNGLKAVETWQKTRPKVILMDVSMPIMNGHEATRKIRELEQKLHLDHTPIIGVTAHAQESDKEQCLAAGMDDYLSKPISPERLQDKLRQWMPTKANKKTG